MAPESRQVPVEARAPGSPGAMLPLDAAALDALFGALADGVLWQDRGIVAYVNPALVRGLGFGSLDELRATGSDAIEARAVERGWARVSASTIDAASAQTLVVFRRADGAHADAQQEVRMQKTLLEAQMESVLDGILVVSLDGEILSHNKLFAQIWGVPDAIMGARRVEEARRIAVERVRDPDVFLRGTAYYHEHADEVCRDEIELKDGRVLDRHGAPVRGPDGRLIGRIWSFRDITARKRAEEALRYQRAVLQSQMDAVQDAIIVVSATGDVVAHNRRFTALWGLPDETLEATRADLTLEALASRVIDAAAFVEGVERLRAATAPLVRDEVRLQDGRVFERYGAPIRGAAGESYGRVWTFRDITQSKTIEERTRQLLGEITLQRLRLDAIISSVPGVVWEAWGSPDAAHQRIDFVSEYVEKMLGYTTKDWTTTPNFWLTLVHPDDRSQARAESSAIFHSGRAGSLEFRWIAKDGRVLWIQAHTVSIRDEQGRPVGTRGVALDVSERKRAEQALVRRAEELGRVASKLERSNKELDQFAYVTSHDLKAPLRGIANLSRWIEEDLGDTVTPDAREHLDLLRGRVQRMERLIEAILEYSRVGRQRARIERVDVGQLLGETIDLLAPPPGFRIEAVGAMPQVDAERARLQQVFMNLISNAVKHHHDPAHGWVRVTHRDLGDADEFAVSDNGPGIAERYHERVFVIFQTLEARDKVEGTGIGLALVKKIVESQGGTIRIESDEGHGASFTFTWPKRPRPESTKETEPA